MIKVLLVCGGGASSGFMAQSMRKYASKNDLSIDVMARSETEIDSYKNEIDVILVGPHLKYLMKDIEDKVADMNIPVGLFDQMVYSTFNGEEAIKQVNRLLEGEE